MQRLTRLLKGRPIRKCYKPGMELTLYFMSIPKKIYSVSYKLNGNEVAVLEGGEGGVLKTSYPDQISHLEDTIIGLKLKYEGKLDIRGQWMAMLSAGDSPERIDSYSFTDTVEIDKPIYRIINTAPITVSTKEKEVLLPFSYEQTTDNNCIEFNVPIMTWSKMNSDGEVVLARCGLLAKEDGCGSIMQEYDGRLIVDPRRKGSISIKNPLPNDSARYTLLVTFDKERSASGRLQLTVIDSRFVADFEFRLAALINTERKVDSTRASATFTQALSSLTSSMEYRSYNFIPLVRSGPCTTAMANRQIFDVWLTQFQEKTLTTDAIRGFIVNDCDEACSVYSAFAGFLKTPVVTYGCASDVYISDRGDNSTLIRTIPSLSRLADAFCQLMNHFRWTRLAVLSTLSMKMESAALAFDEYMSNRTFRIFRYRVNTLSSLYRSNPKSIMEDAFQAVKEKYRIVLLLLEPKVVIEFLTTVRSLGYALHFVFLTINNQFENDHYFSDLRSAEMFKLQAGVISASIKSRDPPKSRRQAGSNGNAEYHWAGYMYDAVQILIKAWHDECTKGPSISFNNSNAVSYARSVNLENTTRKINDENGMGLADYRFQIIQSGLALDISKYFAVGSNHTPVIIDFNLASKIEWPNGVVPSDNPCQKSDCSDDLAKSREPSFSKGAGGIITYTCILLAFCFLIIIILFMIRRQIIYNKIVQTRPDWIIPWSELQIKEPDLPSSISTLSTTTESVVLYNADGLWQTYVSNAVYKGNVVAIKELNCTQIDVTKTANILDIAEILSVRHENLNLFIGVSVQSPHVATVWLYANRGSIDDLLQTNNHCLNNFDLLASLLLDIAQGMRYLHRSQIGSHGRLKSTNCVVDERWTCRVTDYGMGHIRNCGSSRLKADEVMEDDRTYNDQLWTAPELLRMKSRPLNGTKKGDVYSFGIILQEVLLMDVPYSLNMEINVNLDPKDIIEKVRDMDKDSDPYRPILPIDCSSDVQWVYLAKRCWNENSSERPTFSHIRDDIIRLANFEEMDFIDKTLLMLEEYHVNLMGLVHRRQEKVEMEKRKTEDLVYSLIPREMTKMLEYGQAPEPAMYDSVTVYYSSVDQQIASMPGESTPNKVILLMNTICNCFDTIIDQYDVQKVDSIGDMYVVAGGLKQNTKKVNFYAWQTATMALHLLSAVKTLRLPDIPNDYIKIRIGLHTGSVFAGVIGTNKLRYNIFGETLQIAERIQALDEAENRIIVSAATEILLRTSGSFNVQSRGLSEVIKGKTLETFFLLDKTGFVLKTEDLIAAAYLPRSPYFASRDRRPNPFATGKPMMSPVTIDIIPATLANPPRIPDNPPPRIPIVPIVEETLSAEDVGQPPSSAKSERVILLKDQFNEYKKPKARLSATSHAEKPKEVAPVKLSRDRKRSTMPSHTKSPEKQRKELIPKRQTSPVEKQSLSKRHTVIHTPAGFTYKFLSKVPQQPDTKRKSSKNQN